MKRYLYIYTTRDKDAKEFWKVGITDNPKKRHTQVTQNMELAVNETYVKEHRFSNQVESIIKVSNKLNQAIEYRDCMGVKSFDSKTEWFKGGSEKVKSIINAAKKIEDLFKVQEKIFIESNTNIDKMENYIDPNVCFSWCIKNDVKVYPVPTLNSKEMYIEIDNRGLIIRSPQTYTSKTIYDKIHELYCHYYTTNN